MRLTTRRLLILSLLLFAAPLLMGSTEANGCGGDPSPPPPRISGNACDPKAMPDACPSGTQCSLYYGQYICVHPCTADGECTSPSARSCIAGLCGAKGCNTFVACPAGLVCSSLGFCVEG